MKFARRARGFAVVATSVVALLVAGAGSAAAAPAPSPVANTTDVLGPESARAAQLPLAGRPKPGRAGFLGVMTEVDAGGGKLVVASVAPDSPAQKAGLRGRDVIERVDGQPVGTVEAFRHVVQLKPPGRDVVVSVLRGGAAMELKATLASVASAGRPTTRPAEGVSLGVRTGETRPQGGERVSAIDPESPAAAAGLRIGDFIVKVNDTVIDASTRLVDALAGRKPDEVVSVSVLRDGKPVELKARLAQADAARRAATTTTANGAARGRAGFGFGSRGPGVFKKDVLRVAVVGVEFADVKHNPKVTTQDWDRAFFSRNAYLEQSPTGQPVYGSVNDYYQEVSAGAMRVEGKVFDRVELSKKRLDYYTPPTRGGGGDGAGPASRPAGGGRGGRGAGRGGRGGAAVYDTEFLNDVIDKLTDREGANVLNGYDGLVVLYAGGRPVRGNGNVYWPHTSGMVYRNQRLMYFIAEEGGQRMTNISLFCHETGHILGLPDLYVQRNPGEPPSADAVGLGNWCLMSVQVSNGRPQHMSAWSKERLGWIKPTVIDPSVRQRLVLGPIENAPRECFKIPLRPDGSEYLLLENRQKIGFDASVPAEGLLVWRVTNGRPVLVEAHGLTGPRAPTMNVQNIPYPTPRNSEYTPYSKPSSAIESDDAQPVYITDIRRLPDSKVAFSVGYAFD